MSITSRNGVELYYETFGTGPALVLLHGFYGSSQDWHEYGYISAFSSSFTVITTDSRGHGKSGKPVEPTAYRICDYASDVRQVLCALGVHEYHLIGFSNGGRTGFALSTMSDVEMLSFVCIGMHPFEDSMQPIREGVGQLDIWAKELPVSASHRERLLQNDKRALRAAAELDRPKEEIGWITMPTLFIAGTLDEYYGRILQAVSMIPAAEVLSLEGATHVDCLTKSDLVLPRIQTFLSNHAAGKGRL